MAIAFDNATAANGNALIGTPFTFSHTVAGANRGLVLAIACNPAATLTATYAGVSMTLVHVDAGRRVFYLAAPSTGANNIAVTTDGDTAVYCATASYTGVSQTGQPATSAEELITGMTQSNKHVVDLTISATAWLVMGALGYVEDRTPTSDDATRRASSISGVASIFDSNADVAAGARSLNWYYATNTSSDAYAVIMALEPFGDVGGVSWLPQSGIARGRSFIAVPSGLIVPNTPS